MRIALAVIMSAALAAPALGQQQDRDTKVRNDRKAFEGSTDWIYNDLAEGVRAAKTSGKPLMVVFRCIPCEACQEFDDDVARRDAAVRDLLDQFVCVRIVQANAIDLTRFQYDFDLSFSIVLMNADGTVYGRFATRSDRPEFEDITLAGLRATLAGALKLHKNYPAVRDQLAGKQPKPTKYKTPRDFPNLRAKYGDSLNYEGQVARSCIHCHQIRDSERLAVRTEQKTIPDEVLFPYPDPTTLGLLMDPAQAATISRVSPGSAADKAGLKPGDQLAKLDGQPLLSTADIQWVLQHAPRAGSLPVSYTRSGETKTATIALVDGWRHADVSWRPTSWELRRMAFGGMRVDDIDDAERKTLSIANDAMALRIRHVGEFGDHAIAKKAGFKKGDVIVGFDGIAGRRTESQIFAHALQQRKPGDRIAVTVLRDGERKTLEYQLP